MTDFEKRQLLRKDKRRVHQKAMNKLMHKLGGRLSNDWAIHTYAIERQIRRLGELALKDEANKKYEKLMSTLSR